jgi:hypothetical protein
MPAALRARHGGEREHGRNTVSARRLDERATVCNHGVVAVEDETADTSPSESLDKGVDLFDISDFKPVYPKAEARCSLLDHAHAHGGHAVHRIPDHRNALGDSELVQQLDPLAADAVVIGY